MRCGGLVVSVPATRFARPGFESRPGASHKVVGGAADCLVNTVQINKTRPRLAESKKKRVKTNMIVQ